MTQNEIEEGKLQVEQGKLKLAQETLDLERQKCDVQRGTLTLEAKKSIWTPVSIVASTAVAVVGLLANGCLQRDIERRTASDNFKLKAAEIVMNSSGVAATKERAAALQNLFPEELSDKFAQKLQAPPPDKPDLAGDPDPKEALIKLLAEHPAQREQIIKDWSAVFTDKWPKCLQTPNPCQ